MKSYIHIFSALALMLLMIFIFSSCESGTMISEIPTMSQDAMETAQNDDSQENATPSGQPAEPTTDGAAQTTEETEIADTTAPGTTEVLDEPTAEVSEETAPSQTDEPYDAVSSIKTIGDAMSQRNGDVEQIAAYNDMVVYVFEKDGTYYRALATATPDQMKAINSLSAADANYEEQFNALVRDIGIDRIEDLSAAMPEQEQLDALVGKTGKDLFDDGWYPVGYNLSTMRVTLRNGMFDYNVVFEKNADEETPEKVNATEYFGKLPIQSIVCSGIGDATDLDTIAW